MKFDFYTLQEILNNWSSAEIPTEPTKSDSVLERLRQILFKFKEIGTLDKSDLIPLIRQVLLLQSNNSSQEIRLLISGESPWPSITEWNKGGITAIQNESGGYLLSANNWHPDWLDPSQKGVFADAFTDKVVRTDGRCQIDPFVANATGNQHYLSPGQRESVRGAFLIPEGETLIVNLPTGSGKSLVGQVPSIVNDRSGFLTIFVVPTVALAIDQERQMKLYFEASKKFTKLWPLAWHGGTSDSDKAQIRDRLNQGTQKILFVSPEALTKSLLKVIYKIALEGMLNYLVIDEAHLTVQWGDEFRPEFQVIAGLRHSLLRKLRSENRPLFRTLLLSATYTKETIETLANLFGPPDKVQMISAVHLRPEPQYWFSHADSFSEKESQVLEALRYAPRPFILYVTKQQDCVKWEKILKSNGYKRITRFDGKTSDTDRKRIINEWIENKLDGVVATSAFGVGIDKGDVRTVIHATIPETLDRYYQEVGRGGRDGKSSVSLVVYENSDWDICRRMANPTLISNELGMKRWESLYQSRKIVTEDPLLFELDLGVIRQGLTESNDENIKWNVRTLLLMSRAGFIELNIAPIQDNNFLERDASEDYPLHSLTSLRVRILRDDHLAPEAWENVISASRKRTLDSGGNNLRLMEQILKGGSEVSDVLSHLYSNNSSKWPVVVTKICGGCPSDRNDYSSPDKYHMPVAKPIGNAIPVDLTSLKNEFPQYNPELINIFYDPLKNNDSQLIKVISWIVNEFDIKEIGIDQTKGISKLEDFRNLYQRSKSKALITRELSDFHDEPYTPLGRISILGKDSQPRLLNEVIKLNRPIHILILPSDMMDPNHHSRKYIDTAINELNLDQLIGLINK
ncbi:ATP-dependent DNA helicase RecQ [Polynucleobacter paneuropaeus]|nr:ATP-dependent DNA helicase RecQ [Polynucleobacter paneuropaeus]